MSIVIFLFGYTASPSPFCANDSWHVLPLGWLLGRKLEGILEEFRGLKSAGTVAEDLELQGDS